MPHDLQSVEDIILSAQRIRTYLDRATPESFAKDEQLQDAVIRRFEIIGEAASRLSADFRAQHPDVPWRQLIGMRNRMIHGYDSIDRDIVWETAHKYIPVLLGQLEGLTRVGGAEPAGA